MHGEQLVELFIRQELETRAEKLSTNQKGHETTKEEEQERSDDVHHSELLMIRRGQHTPGKSPLRGGP